MNLKDQKLTLMYRIAHNSDQGAENTGARRSKRISLSTHPPGEAIPKALSVLLGIPLVFLVILALLLRSSYHGDVHKLLVVGLNAVISVW